MADSSSSSIKKTIKINPVLFQTKSSSTTTRKKEKKSSLQPLIHPNVLKKTLLSRIKEHKTGAAAGAAGAAAGADGREHP